MLCTVLPINTVWHDFFFFFLWINYMVNQGFVTWNEKDTKPINFILLPSNPTSPKALLSPDVQVVLDICSCSDISVHVYTVWLFRV